MTELWILQSKDQPGDYWVAITTAIPFDEVDRHVNIMLGGYRLAKRQHYYRAYCVNDDKQEDKNWQALPDFPEFTRWVEPGVSAQMEDGTTWSKENG